MNRLNTTLAALFAASALAGAAQATTVNLSYNNGSLFNTTGISTFDVKGSDMSGMAVTACFTVGACETLAWQTLPLDGPSFGGVVGSGWSLKLDGDSFISNFVLRASLTGSSMVSLSINGRPGLTAFDVTPGVNGSPDSALGLPFTLMSGPGPGPDVDNVDVVYSDKLSVGGVFYDDLFTLMTVNFRGGVGFSVGRMEFRTDTDKTLNGAPITPGGTPVPTPGTLALVGLGLLAAAAKTRRRTRA